VATNNEPHHKGELDDSHMCFANFDPFKLSNCGNRLFFSFFSLFLFFFFQGVFVLMNMRILHRIKYLTGRNMDGRVTFDFFLGRGTKCDLPKGGRAVEIRYA
jgi:hypothetical protein